MRRPAPASAWKLLRVAARRSSSPLVAAAALRGRLRADPVAAHPRGRFAERGVGPSESPLSASAAASAGASASASASPPLLLRLRFGAVLSCSSSSGAVGMPCTRRCFAIVDASIVFKSSSPRPSRRPP